MWTACPLSVLHQQLWKVVSLASCPKWLHQESLESLESVLSYDYSRSSIGIAVWEICLKHVDCSVQFWTRYRLFVKVGLFCTLTLCLTLTLQPTLRETQKGGFQVSKPIQGWRNGTLKTRQKLPQDWQLDSCTLGGHLDGKWSPNDLGFALLESKTSRTKGQWP